MYPKRTGVLFFSLLLGLGVVFQAPVQAKADLEKSFPRARGINDFQKEIVAAIEKGQSYLFDHQGQNGNWPMYKKHHVGLTALVTLALIKSGISNRDPRIERAMGWIKKKQPVPEMMYDAGILLMLLDTYGREMKSHSHNPYDIFNKEKQVPRGFKPEIKTWMEEIVAQIETHGAKFEVQWKIPEPLSKGEVQKRLKELEKQEGKGAKTSRKSRKVSYKKKKDKVSYELTDPRAFKIWRWHYFTNKVISERHDWDNSNLQYTYLGLKAAKRWDIKIKDRNLWYGALLHWLETQEKSGTKVPRKIPVSKKNKKGEGINPYDKEGLADYKFKEGQVDEARGWGYMIGKSGHAGGPTRTMTPGGISSLILIRSVLYKDVDYLAYFEAATEKAVADGFAWLDAHWETCTTPESEKNFYYTAYGIERVGVFAGVEFIGDHPWYKDLVEQLLPLQDGEGWFKVFKTKLGDDMAKMVNTSWALLVLSRGSEPVNVPPMKVAGYQVKHD